MPIAIYALTIKTIICSFTNKNISCFLPVFQWITQLTTTPPFGHPALAHQTPCGSLLRQVLPHLHGAAQALPSNDLPPCHLTLCTGFEK